MKLVFFSLLFLGHSLFASDDTSASHFQLDHDKNMEFIGAKGFQRLFSLKKMIYLDHYEIEHTDISHINQKEIKRYKDSPRLYQDLEKRFGPYIHGKKDLPLTSVQWIGDEIGYGLFAKELIKAGSFINVYTGILTLHKDIEDRDYSWSYPVKSSKNERISVDSKAKGNELRYVNDSKDPNLTMKYIFSKGFWFIGYIANKDISPNEQLSISYGKKYWSTRPNKKYLELSEAK